MVKYTWNRKPYNTAFTIYKDGKDYITLSAPGFADEICDKLNRSEPSNEIRTIVATACLQGILSTLSNKTYIGPHIAENCAKEAVLCADELLKQLKK